MSMEDVSDEHLDARHTHWLIGLLIKPRGAQDAAYLVGYCVPFAALAWGVFYLALGRGLGM